MQYPHVFLQSNLIFTNTHLKFKIEYIKTIIFAKLTKFLTCNYQCRHRMIYYWKVTIRIQSLKKYQLYTKTIKYTFINNIKFIDIFFLVFVLWMKEQAPGTSFECSLFCFFHTSAYFMWLRRRLNDIEKAP